MPKKDFASDSMEGPRLESGQHLQQLSSKSDGTHPCLSVLRSASLPQECCCAEGCLGYFQLLQHYIFSTASRRRVMSVNATKSFLVIIERERERERESGRDSIFEVRKQDRCLRYSFLLRMFQDDLINLDSSIPNRCNIAAAVSKRHTL